MTDGEKGALLLTEAVDAFEKVSSEEMRKSFTGRYYLGSLLGGNQSMEQRGPSYALPEPLRRRMLSMLLLQLDQIDPGLQASAYSSGMPNAANACRTQKAWEEFVALLERGSAKETQHA